MMKQNEAEKYIGLNWYYKDMKFEVIGFDNYLSSNKFKVKVNNTIMYIPYRDIRYLEVENIYESYKKFYS